MDYSTLPRNEYPRPQLMRDEDTWQCLNGEWEFELDLCKSGTERGLQNAEHLNGKITVPFVPESELSGVCFTDFIEGAWYKRLFTIQKKSGERILIHFGAVNHHATVYINSRKVGTHVGGYTPFEFDITNYCADGENTLTVYVENNVRDPLQPSGKQSTRFAPYNCLYTRCTGIWQSVWLENVPDTYIKRVKLIPDAENGVLHATVYFGGTPCTQTLRATAAFGGDTVCSREVKCIGDSVTFSLEIANCVKWDVGCGNLYDLTLSTDTDLVVSYFGMRDISVSQNKVLINGKSVFQRLVLDQGYYEGGIYTPKDAEAFEKDISLAMAAGFNGARMHMKVFDPVYIAAADRAGFLLWEEYPTWGLDYEKKGVFEAVAVPWREVCERDISSPSVICRCPFNETWSHSIDEMLTGIYNLTKSIDESRLAVDTSGYIHSKCTDIYDVHDYEQSPEVMKERYDTMKECPEKAFVNFPEYEKYDGKKPYIVSEFGGAFWDGGNGEGNNQNAAWGYGKTPDSESAFTDRFEALCDVFLKNPAICGFCYTQLTDVMQEKNGILYFDRTPKFDLQKLSRAVSKKAAIED